MDGQEFYVDRTRFRRIKCKEHSGQRGAGRSVFFVRRSTADRQEEMSAADFLFGAHGIAEGAHGIAEWEERETPVACRLSQKMRHRQAPAVCPHEAVA